MWWGDLTEMSIQNFGHLDTRSQLVAQCIEIQDVWPCWRRYVSGGWFWEFHDPSHTQFALTTWMCRHVFAPLSQTTPLWSHKSKISLSLSCLGHVFITTIKKKPEHGESLKQSKKENRKIVKSKENPKKFSS